MKYRVIHSATVHLKSAETTKLKRHAAVVKMHSIVCGGSFKLLKGQSKTYNIRWSPKVSRQSSIPCQQTKISQLFNAIPSRVYYSSVDKAKILQRGATHQETLYCVCNLCMCTTHTSQNAYQKLWASCSSFCFVFFSCWNMCFSVVMYQQVHARAKLYFLSLGFFSVSKVR